MMNYFQKSTSKSASTKFIINIKETDWPPILVKKTVTFLERKGNNRGTLSLRQKTRLKSCVEDLDKVATKSIPKRQIKLCRKAIRPGSFTTSHATQSSENFNRSQKPFTRRDFARRKRVNDITQQVTLSIKINGTSSEQIKIKWTPGGTNG